MTCSNVKGVNYEFISTLIPMYKIENNVLVERTYSKRANRKHKLFSIHSRLLFTSRAFYLVNIHTYICTLYIDIYVYLNAQIKSAHMYKEFASAKPSTPLSITYTQKSYFLEVCTENQQFATDILFNEIRNNILSTALICTFCLEIHSWNFFVSMSVVYWQCLSQLLQFQCELCMYMLMHVWVLFCPGTLLSWYQC